MSVYKNILAAALCATALGGCVTGMLWSESGNHYPYSYRKADTDSVHAFALTDTPQGKTLLMLGKKYSYGIADENLIGVMTAKLSQRFEIYEYLGGKKLAAMPVDIPEKGGEDFHTSFCLRYPIEAVKDGSLRSRETEMLEQLGFDSPHSGETTALKQSGLYTGLSKCFGGRKGKIYIPQPVAKIPASYRFEQGVPVEIRHLKHNRAASAFSTLGKIVVTPATLAADIVLFPITLPYALNGFSIM
ncbi:hypothetical protein [Neisseria sp.]|uniref:hypothetical protein n=1 Tax=Neisseria sp. TaxID=192066 RepID=UPI0035A0B998